MENQGIGRGRGGQNVVRLGRAQGRKVAEQIKEMPEALGSVPVEEGKKRTARAGWSGGEQGVSQLQKGKLATREVRIVEGANDGVQVVISKLLDQIAKGSQTVTRCVEEGQSLEELAVFTRNQEVEESLPLICQLVNERMVGLDDQALGDLIAKFPIGPINFSMSRSGELVAVSQESVRESVVSVVLYAMKRSAVIEARARLSTAPNGALKDHAYRIKSFFNNHPSLEACCLATELQIGCLGRAKEVIEKAALAIKNERQKPSGDDALSGRETIYGLSQALGICDKAYFQVLQQLAVLFESYSEWKGLRQKFEPGKTEGAISRLASELAVEWQLLNVRKEANLESSLREQLDKLEEQFRSIDEMVATIASLLSAIFDKEQLLVERASVEGASKKEVSDEQKALQEYGLGVLIRGLSNLWPATSDKKSDEKRGEKEVPQISMTFGGFVSIGQLDQAKKLAGLWGVDLSYLGA